MSRRLRMLSERRPADTVGRPWAARMVIVYCARTAVPLRHARHYLPPDHTCSLDDGCCWSQGIAGAEMGLAAREEGLAGRGCFGGARVQPFPDLLRGIGAAAPFGTGDHRPGGGDAGNACQAQDFPPAHLLRLDHARRAHHP